VNSRGVNAIRGVHTHKENIMMVHIGPLIALIAGILILVMPRLLNYIVAIYLIAIGLLGLLGSMGGKF
jgi:hypothetical protein